MEGEANIQGLLERIKKQGVEEANKSAQEIVEKARAEADAMVRNAKNEAEAMRKRADEEIQKRQYAVEQELLQAGRDLILSVRQEIVRLIDHIVLREVKSALGPDLMKALLSKLVGKWERDEDSAEIEVLLNEEQRQQLEEMGWQALQAALKKGVVLKPVKTIEAGFRIGEKDGHIHYDFTDQGIAEVLTAYLNPRVARVLSEAVAGRKEQDA